MKAYLIDPTTRTVKPLLVSERLELPEIYRLLECDLIDVVDVSSGPAPRQQSDHSLYVDDEGLFKPEPSYFRLGDHSQPFAGKALLLGNGWDQDQTHMDVSPTLTLAELCGMVAWCVPSQRELDKLLCWEFRDLRTGEVL